jgi:competence protein ComEA
MVRWTKHIAGTLVYMLLGGTTVWGQQPAETSPPATAAATATGTTAPAGTKVNINTADEASLEALKGIGKTKAKAIIEYRQKNGPFKTVDDLKNVKGIGDKLAAQLKDQVTVE